MSLSHVKCGHEKKLDKVYIQLTYKHMLIGLILLYGKRTDKTATSFWRATSLQDSYTLIAVLTQDEKVDLYFDEALPCMNLSEVKKGMKDYVSALLPKAKEQIKFWGCIPKNPQNEDTWKPKSRKMLPT